MRVTAVLYKGRHGTAPAIAYYSSPHAGTRLANLLLPGWLRLCATCAMSRFRPPTSQTGMLACRCPARPQTCNAQTGSWVLAGIAQVGHGQGDESVRWCGNGRSRRLSPPPPSLPSARAAPCRTFRQAMAAPAPPPLPKPHTHMRDALCKECCTIHCRSCITRQTRQWHRHAACLCKSQGSVHAAAKLGGVG